MLDPDVELGKGIEAGMSIDVEMAHVTLSTVTECITTLIPDFSEDGSDAGLDVCNKGGALLDMMEEAKKRLGINRVRDINGNNLEKSLLEFTDQAESFDVDVRGGKSKTVIKMLRMNTSALVKNLKRSWNVDLGPVPTDQEEVIESGQWAFSRCTPTKQDAIVHTCPHCHKEFKNSVVLERHLKDCDGSGPSNAGTEDFKVSHPRVTCRLSHKNGKTCSVRWDQFGRHLRTVHKIDRPVDKVPQGFVSTDGRKTWTIVFAEKGAKDPEPPANAVPLSNSAKDPCNNNPASSELTEQEITAEDPEPSHSASIDVPLLSTSPAPNNDNPAVIIEPSRGEPNKSIAVEVTTMDESEANIKGSPDFMGFLRAQERYLSSPPSNRLGMWLSDLNESDLNIDDVSSDKETFVLDHLKQMEDWPSSQSDHDKVGEGDRESSQLASVEPEPEKSIHDQAIDDENYVQDEFCASYEEHQEAVEVEIEKLQFDSDSDIHDSDSESFTSQRLHNKKRRYAERNVKKTVVTVAQMPGNIEFYEEMIDHLYKESSSTNENNAILTNAKNYLFNLDDSYLRFMMNKIPGFKMSQLVDFNGQQFVQLSEPYDWVNSIGGDSGKEEPGRRKDMLKTFKRLIQFVQRKLNSYNFGNDTLSIVRRNTLRGDLKQLNEDIDSCKLMSKLEKLAESDRMARRLARETLHPGQAQKEVNGNKVYFASEAFSKRQTKMNEIFNTSMETKKITDTSFTEIANFARGILAFTDRNRSSVFRFTNGDYIGKVSLWFPAGHNRDGQFDGLPDECVREQPPDNREPDLFMIQLTGKGDGLKMSRAVTVTILPFVDSWLRKFRMLKDLKFGSPLDLDAPFFQSASGKELARMVNTRGSLLQEYGKVTGIDSVTQNVLRRSLEPHVQGNPELRARNTAIVNHSVNVSKKHYDSTDAMYRSSALHYVSQQEELGVSQNQENLDEEVVAKRARLEKEDEAANVERARSLLKRKVNKNISVGPRCKLTPENRFWIQKNFSKGGKFEEELRHHHKFPGPKKFRSVLYRKLDSMNENDEDAQRLSAIESETFAVIKSKACEGEWDGSLVSNKNADELVAKTIHQSLKNYEITKKEFEDSYFKF